MQTLKIRHNMEVAHRLSLLPGKCQQIHGHSMWVVAEFEGEVDHSGILLGMDFGSVKGVFRNHLDKTYDHHLLLNHDDPLLTMLGTNAYEDFYPGLAECVADPTTENIAKWIGEWCLDQYSVDGLERVKVEVWETQVNSATWEVVNAGSATDRVVS